MPAPGEQHINNLGRAIPNPFEEVKPHISEYTAQEIATLQSRLEKQLGPEYISSRVGPSGQKVHYIAAEKCIQLANEIFGFNGWSSSIRELQVDFVDENPHTLKVSLGLSVIVRVTLRDGTYHEDIGYGHIENCKGKAAAFEKAKKEGTTDALKRALRNFGNVLGNCIYDRDYLAKVTKIKIAPSKWDVEGLHRHSDYVPDKKGIVTNLVQEEKQSVVPNTGAAEAAEDEYGDFDEADFAVTHDHEAHPDEVVISNVNQARQQHISRSENPRSTTPANTSAIYPNLQSISGPPRQSNAVQPPNINGNGLVTPQRQPLNPNIGIPKPPNTTDPGEQGNVEATIPRTGQIINPKTGRVLNQPSRTEPPSAPSSPKQHTRRPSVTDVPTPVSNTSAEGNAAAGFLSAKALSKEPDAEGSITNLPPGVSPAFNPRAESPTLWKTPGIDHSRSRPISRDLKHVPGNVQNQSAPSPTTRGNFVNPQLDAARRIGAPASPSPLNNRSSYRPPTMTGKRPNDVANGPPRPPLSDLAPNSAGAATDGANDAKRQKTSDA